MFSKVLFPTDFSDSAEIVKNNLLKLDGTIKSLTLLAVIDSRLFSYTTMLDEIEIDNLNIQGQIYSVYEEKLKNWVKEFEAKGTKTRYLIVEGIPLDEILREADEGNYTSIFVGEKGQTAGERLVLGSTAEKVIRKAKQTVVLVK